MIENYILKHKNIELVDFQMDSNNFEILDINKIINEEHLPFTIREENKIISCVNELTKWIKYRGIPESRKNYTEILENMKADNAIELSVNSFALNLSDQYFLHKSKYNIKWEDYNFFDNKFNKLVEKEIFPENIDKESSNINPDFSVDGQLIKTWVCDGKDRVLLKEGSTENNQQPYNEKIASLIMDMFDIEHVKYDVKKIKGKIVSVCKCMVDRETELIPASYIFEKEKNIINNPYEYYINACKIYGKLNIKEKLEQMICIDYIMGNTDRHRKNFGIIRNANTLEWIKVAPIFDNGNSLNYKSGDIQNIIKYTDSYCKWYLKYNYDKLKYIEYPQWYTKDKGRNIIDIINNTLKENKHIKNKHLNNIISIVNNRIKIFENEIENKVNNILPVTKNVNNDIILISSQNIDTKNYNTWDNMKCILEEKYDDILEKYTHLNKNGEKTYILKRNIDKDNIQIHRLKYDFTKEQAIMLLNDLDILQKENKKGEINKHLNKKRK